MKEWKLKEETYKKYVINLSENLGGSGGFYEGLKFFSNSEYDWCFLSDDDAYLEKNCIQNLYKHIKENNLNNDISAICSEVISNGKVGTVHRRVIKQGLINVYDKEIPESDYSKKSIEINALTYVGVAINKQKLLEAGLTNKDYFIHYDDTEHSYRLSKVGKIIVYPDIIMHHDVKENASSSRKVTWTYYYDVRNILVFYKYNFKKVSFYSRILYEIIKSIGRLILRHDSNALKIVRIAIHDARIEKMGKNSIYKPGWKNE